jgi:hypothetical protein
MVAFNTTVWPPSAIAGLYVGVHVVLFEIVPCPVYAGLLFSSVDDIVQSIVELFMVVGAIGSAVIL